MPLSARVIAKGPLVLMGELEGFKLIGEDNALIDIAGRDKLVLCRCGASVNKPFCDGTHTKIGFDAAEPAVHAREWRRPSALVPKLEDVSNSSG